MSASNSFHEVRFPIDLALGATGGPQRRTEVVTLGSGLEQRNARWRQSRRRFNAGYGIKTIADLQSVVAFFEERRGRLFGFRFRDPFDWKTSAGNLPTTATDQEIGIGDGTMADFQLAKRYGSRETGYVRIIRKPIAGTIKLAVNGTFLNNDAFKVDPSRGVVSLAPHVIPVAGEIVTAGFEFDIPVRFDSDEISINLSHFEAGDIPSIPLVELLQ